MNNAPERYRYHSAVVTPVLTLTLVAAFLVMLALALALGSSSPAEAHTPGAGAQPLESPTAIPECSQGWHRVPWPMATPTPDPYAAFLSASAVAPDDAWAVGGAGTHHWDGISWTQVATTTAVHDVAASAGGNVWGVGYWPNNGYAVARWSGTEWEDVPLPAHKGYWILFAIAARTPDDVWVVGEDYRGEGRYSPPLVLHWTGSWTVAKVEVEIPGGSPGKSNGPLPSEEYVLTSVATDGPDSMWAVGFYDGYDLRPIVVRVCPSACSGGTTVKVYGRFSSVAVAGPDDVWAVGSSSMNIALVQHWDGVAWSAVDGLPESGGAQSVVAPAPNDVWVLAPSIGYYQALHWDGSAWTQFRIPSANGLISLAASSPDDIWAVGFRDTVHYPTAPQDFTDVPPDSTFYPYAQPLYCAGVVSGYACGPGAPCDNAGLPYFRPGNQITRGQLSKIVSNSAGFNDDPGAQIFEDMLPGSSFYTFTQRLASRLIIAGYPCGGPGEPCVAPNNLPYFRPSANVTRGQTAKIVAIAKGLPAPPPGQQTFEDVVEGSNFWQWVEALSTSGAISGYACGGVGEPCVSPDDRPYFRTSLNITRGQTAKIVVNCFFPGN